jgi:hypothetical protein
VGGGYYIKTVIVLANSGHTVKEQNQKRLVLFQIMRLVCFMRNEKVVILAVLKKTVAICVFCSSIIEKIGVGFSKIALHRTNVKLDIFLLGSIQYGALIIWYKGICGMYLNLTVVAALGFHKKAQACDRTAHDESALRMYKPRCTRSRTTHTQISRVLHKHAAC